MRCDLRPRAVIRVDGPLAYICAWCPDKPAADVWAADRGLMASHGICQACKRSVATEVIFEAGERRVAHDPAQGPQATSARETAPDQPSRLVVFSCRLGGAAS